MTGAMQEHEMPGSAPETFADPELVEPYVLEPAELEDWDDDSEFDEAIFAGLLRLAP